MKLLTALVAATLLLACAPKRDAVKTHRGLTSSNSTIVDLSGHWELDYALSDSLEHKVHMHFLERQYSSARQYHGQSLPPVVSPRSGLAAYARLGYFTEEITRIPEMEVRQDEAGIRVIREGDYSLDCRYGGGDAAPRRQPMGLELCGWSGHAMVFVASMPDGLSVVHRFTLGADRQRMTVATTVRTAGISGAFTLNRVYNRFQPLPSEYECETTLERGRSCRRIRSG